MLENHFPDNPKIVSEFSPVKLGFINDDTGAGLHLVYVDTSKNTRVSETTQQPEERMSEILNYLKGNGYEVVN